MKRTKSQFTKYDLIVVANLYDKNCDKMLAAVDTPKHAHYIARESRLYRLDKKIRKALGIWVESPCPLSRLGNFKNGKYPIPLEIDCSKCTGYYRKEDLIYSMRSSGTRCRLKHIKLW